VGAGTGRADDRTVTTAFIGALRLVAALLGAIVLEQLGDPRGRAHDDERHDEGEHLKDPRHQNLL